MDVFTRFTKTTRRTLIPTSKNLLCNRNMFRTHDSLDSYLNISYQVPVPVPRVMQWAVSFWAVIQHG
jgi:hypothetical protein